MGINKINIKNNGDSMNGHLSVQTHGRVSQHDRIFQPYPKYKNSNIPWLGEIPEHWEVKRAKWIFREVDFRSETGNEELLSVSEHFGVIKRKNANVNMFKAASYIGYKLCNPGDLVINSLWAWSRGLGFSKYHGIVSTAYGVYRPNQNEVSDYQYFHYLLRTKIYVGQYAIRSKGIWISRLQLSDKNFLDIPILIPPKQEQTAIARFLDYKLAKINRFIRKKKQLITLLNEQKAAIINQAVTKGLDPNTKMKDSGIEWLGEIPEHWEVRKLKYVANVVLGKMLCNEDKGDYFKKPYLKSKNIQWLNVDISDVEEMWFSNSELEIYRLKKGDLILSEGGEVGKTCMWNDELDECYIQNSAHKVSINSGNLNTYFLYLFNTYGKKGGFDSIVNRVSIAHLTKDKLINIKCLVPPLSEQQQIVSHIEKETAIINTTISKIEKEIALVEEYKTALIAEAVTGKIDVRGYEVPEISEEETYEEIEEIGMAAEDAEAYQTVEE